MATPVLTGTKSEQIAPLTKRKAWKALGAHHKAIGEQHLRDLSTSGANWARCWPSALSRNSRARQSRRPPMTVQRTI